MSNENANQPAYPMQPTVNSEGQICNERYAFEGLTKRELIAAMAMQGILADGGHEFRDTHKERIAHLAIVHADELLNQLNHE